MNRALTKKTITLALALAGIALFAGLLAAFDLSRVIEILSRAKPEYILLAAVFALSSAAAKSLKWRELFFRTPSPLSRRESANTYLQGYFFSLITPARIGDFYRAWAMRKKISLGAGLASVLLDRFIDIGLLLLFSLVGLWAFFVTTKNWIVQPTLVAALLLLSLFAGTYIVRTRQMTLVRFLFERIVDPSKVPNITRSFNETISHVLAARKHPRAIAAAIAFGSASWVGSLCAALSVALALGINLPLPFFISLVPILALIELIPISIAGLGTRETAAILLFQAAGVGAETALAFSLAFFFIGYLFVGLAGGIAFGLNAWQKKTD